MKKILCSLIVFSSLLSLHAGALKTSIKGDKPFRIVYQKNQRGGIVYLSNVGVKCLTKDTASMPPSSAVADNQNYPSRYVDIDNDPSTFMSSADSLILPDCSGISFAGLFWGGTVKETTPGYSDRSKVKISFNNGTYSEIVADSITDFLPNQDVSGWGGSYHCFKDITLLFKQMSGNGRWTIANLVTDTTRLNSLYYNRWSGWNIVVVYKNEEKNLRQLTVFEGLSTNLNTAGSTVDIPVTGFLTPSQGPVTFELGAFGYDGDRCLTGDQLQVSKDGSVFNSISDTFNPYDNVFNSTISRDGKLSSTCVPNFKNNYSIDADIFFPDNSLKNLIGNNASSFIIRTKTDGEGYRTHAISLAIDAKIPDNRLGMKVKDLNGGVVQPGDTLEYTLLACNVGTDVSVLSKITNKIDGNAHFVPGSLRIVSGPNTGAKTDAIGDDQAEYDPSTKTVTVRIGNSASGTAGGTVLNSLSGSDSTVVKFRVTATDDCMQLKCDHIIDNHAFVSGFGKDSGIKFESDQVPQYYDGKTCTISDISNQSSIIIFSDCTIPPPTSNGPICSTHELQLTAPYNNNATYKWVGPNGFTSTEQNPVLKNASIANSGKYTCTVSIKYTATESLLEASCATDYSIDVVVNQMVVSNAGPDQKICKTSTNLQAVAPALGQGTWSEVSTNPTGVSITDVNSPTTKVTFLTPGTYKFKWLIPDNDPLHCVVTADTVSIIFGTDCPPIVLPEYHTIRNDSTATGVLTSNDTSVDGKPLVVDPIPSVNPLHGTIVVKSDGSYTYTPNAGYVGNDKVVVSVCDQKLPQGCSQDTIYITVTKTTSPLILKNDSNIVAECATVGGSIIDMNDVVYQNKPVISAEEGAKARDTKLGTFSLKADGTYSYTAKCGKSGVDTLVVNVCDTQIPQQCKNDTLFVTVVQNKPVAVNDLNMPTIGSLRGNDSPTSDKNVWEKLTDPVDADGKPAGSVVVKPDGTFQYYPPSPDFEGDVTFTYHITDPETGQISNVATVTIKVDPIWIPEGFSPNNDGDHDHFVITNFDKVRFPNNTINIFNRWGNKVYVAHPYNNEWDGTNNQGMSVGGKVLPVGTYFYILDLGNGLKPFRGYVYLNR